MPEDPRSGLPHSVIGTSFVKVDAAAKVAGQTVFADDLVLPRMVFAKLLRSPAPARARPAGRRHEGGGPARRRGHPGRAPSCPSPSASCP